MVKCILYPFDAGIRNANHIITYLSNPWMCHHIIIRTTADFFLLRIWYCIQSSKLLTLTVLYLKKHHALIIPANDIHFSLTAPEIPLHNRNPLLFEILTGGLFIKNSDFSCIHPNLSASLQPLRFVFLQTPYLHIAHSTCSSYCGFFP